MDRVAVGGCVLRAEVAFPAVDLLAVILLFLAIAYATRRRWR